MSNGAPAPCGGHGSGLRRHTGGKRSGGRPAVAEPAAFKPRPRVPPRAQWCAFSFPARRRNCRICSFPGSAGGWKSPPGTRRTGTRSLRCSLCGLWIRLSSFDPSTPLYGEDPGKGNRGDSASLRREAGSSIQTGTRRRGGAGGGPATGSADDRKIIPLREKSSPRPPERACTTKARPRPVRPGPPPEERHRLCNPHAVCLTGGDRGVKMPRVCF